jgi:uncharacterized protein YutE (UPF0331/DUF86 family)
MIKADNSLDTLRNDIDLQDSVLHNLQLAIQGCIDIGSHIISDEGWGIAGSLGDILYTLRDRNVIEADLTERLVAMIGFRNILIHEYDDINIDIVYDILQNRLKDIDQYLLSIIDYFNLAESDKP